ncbi:hypothetical protein L3C95_25210 [Chitinophaga filiformis]|uniref:hypothetical protein n=1 Tax=Chitinophaga filiformis TaxID=104663 RepID=UPI001F20519A|nr:hypothetical protein [Chitinophaga filiformis]MCF6406219.1 hypothetical protein [Chitinophaga filiformis]
MMMKEEAIRITRKRIFIRYNECPMFTDCEDIEVDIPILPVPGNLFDGRFFLNKEQRAKVDTQHALLFVADVKHEFHDMVQHCIIVLQLVPAKAAPLHQSDN